MQTTARRNERELKRDREEVLREAEQAGGSGHDRQAQDKAALGSYFKILIDE